MSTSDLFPEPDLPRLHSRDYDVRAFRRDATTMLVRGAVRDILPAGFYDAADTEPMTMHHMVLDLVVDMGTLEIVDAGVVFEEHPHPACPSIAAHYEKLVGLSVARGFTHRIRELFGGPRGCTHTTALLQAMAPVVMQAYLGSRIIGADAADGAGAQRFGPALTSPEGRRKRIEGNRNTCHIWADDSEFVRDVLETGAVMLPLPIARRLHQRGIDPVAWREGVAHVPDEV